MCDWPRCIGLNKLSRQIEKIRQVLTNLGYKVFWPENQHLGIPQIILDNLASHVALFELENISSGSVDLEENLKLAAQSAGQNDEFVVRLKTVQMSESLSDVLKDELIFSNASNYLALCSYRNQLVCSMVRTSFVCNCVVASMDSNKDNLLMESINLNQIESAFESYKFLTVLFNREFIFKVIYI